MDLISDHPHRISTLGPLEDLLAADSVHSNGHHNTVIRELSHLNIIKHIRNPKINNLIHREGVLAAAGGPLVGDELVALHGHGGLALPAICGVLIKLLSESRVRNFILVVEECPYRYETPISTQ